MAHTADNTLISNGEMIVDLLKKPFVALLNGMIAMAEAGPKMTQLTKLNERSDEELTAAGTSRKAEIDRIFGGYYI